MIRKFSTALKELHWASSAGRAIGLRAGQSVCDFRKCYFLSIVHPTWHRRSCSFSCAAFVSVFCPLVKRTAHEPTTYFRVKMLAAAPTLNPTSSWYRAQLRTGIISIAV